MKLISHCHLGLKTIHKLGLQLPIQLCSIVLHLNIVEILHLPCIWMKGQYPLNRWLSGSQCLSGHFRAEKNLLHLSAFKPSFHCCQAHSPVPTPTTLSCLPRCWYFQGCWQYVGALVENFFSKSSAKAGWLKYLY